jgi:hypothetical protein
MNEGVIVGGDAFEGQRVIYFPADGCLCSYDFAMAFGLLRKDKDGNAAGGYLDPSMHIKALKLRGLRSEGVVIELSRFAGFYKLTPDDFKDGEAIDRIGNELVCKKYIPRSSVRTVGTKTSTKGKKRNGITFPEFDMHIDTSQLLYSENMFREGDEINISLKLHGTSQRSMNTYAEYPNGFWRRLFRMKPKTKPVYALGTRRVVLLQSTLNDGTGFYGNDSFRVQHHEKIKNFVTPGMEVFYEVVGWVSEGTTIMPSCDNKKLNDKAFIKQYGQSTDFLYGCEPGQSEMYIYRICDNGEEYTPLQIVLWCQAAGVKHVPYLETFTFTTWDDLLERVNQLVDGPDLIDPSHVREGIVVRILNRNKFAAYKNKNMSFKILEGIVKADAAEADMEEAQEGEENGS